ncbi:MAG: type II toxin-antitoxin system RelE/ParE family toxin [Deltaproteobacteria bacterium]|nr:type II toxin-antitoxin system RelE/ParE family toxin [Deltaproteobacteria bacterium]
MSRIKKRPLKLLLTERAIADLLAIKSYSTDQWGKRTATRYLADIESGLQFITQNPGLLSPIEGLPETLQHYSVRKHVLICDVRPKSIIVLTVIHGSMDIPNRLSELLPTLSTEVSMLHEKITAAHGR